MASDAHGSGIDVADKGVCVEMQTPTRDGFSSARLDGPLRDAFAAVEAQPVPESLMQLVEALDAAETGARKRA